MNYLLLLGVMTLFLFNQKKRTGWVTAIKDALTKLMVPGADRRLFSSFTSSPIGWVRNKASWVRAYNWTGYAAGINGLGGVGGGTLITGRHVLLANHVPYPARPFDIFFVDANDRTLSYKVTKIEQVGDTDIAIGTLDRAVDPSLKIYRTLPGNWTEYAKLPLPVLYSGMDRKVSTGDVTEVAGGAALVKKPAFEVAIAFSEPLKVGDSGNPIFVQVNDELVLLGCWWKTGYTSAGEVGYFPWIVTYRGAIEKVIGQKLLVADLTGFLKA